MPGGDRKGPLGEGPMTGRKQGLCKGNSEPGYKSSPENGSGGMQGRGSGRRGMRNIFKATGEPGWKRFGKKGSLPEEDKEE